MKKLTILKTVQERSSGPKKNYTIRIDQKVGEDFKEFCTLKGVSMSDLAEEFFRSLMKESKFNPKNKTKKN
jgi:regulator of PEP synthase PpsR (kinase-PPPase family)